MLPDGARIDLGALDVPLLMVVVDTEEEFDWSVPLDRARTSVRHMRSIFRLQEVWDRYAIHPVYAVDFPIADQREGYEPIRALVSDGRAVLGAHLNPWVTPPYEEEVNAFNSYHGNLPPDLEARKLAALADRIEQSIGMRPKVFKAGRYGLGPATFPALLDNGFEVDVSPAPPMDYRVDGGPNYAEYGVRPFWWGGKRRLLCIPGTGDFIGALAQVMRGAEVQRLIEMAPLRRLRAAGILSRLRLFSRMRLTPEGYTLAELKALTAVLLARGVRYFHLTLHSASIEPGNTPYVRDDADRGALFGRLDGYLRYFMEDVGGRPTDPLTFRDLLLEGAAASGTPHERRLAPAGRSPLIRASAKLAESSGPGSDLGRGVQRDPLSGVQEPESVAKGATTRARACRRPNINAMNRRILRPIAGSAWH